MSPPGINLRRFPRDDVISNSPLYILCSLVPISGSNEPVALDDGKAFGLVTALEFERLVIGGVDTNHLPRIKIGTKARRGVSVDVCRIPDHRLECALTAAWLKES